MQDVDGAGIFLIDRVMDVAKGPSPVARTAADGVGSARRRAAVVKPDVVLMDMRLSDGDGAQATAEVQPTEGRRVQIAVDGY